MTSTEPYCRSHVPSTAATNQLLATSWQAGGMHLLCPPAQHEDFRHTSKEPCSSRLVKASEEQPCLLLMEIVNASFKGTYLLNSLKNVIVRPILKNLTLDPEDLSYHHPFSNLPFLGKVTKKIVTTNLQHLTSAASWMPHDQGSDTAQRQL